MWTCANICQLQSGTSQTNRVLSLHISLNIITSLANVHLQVLSIYIYNYFNTQTFMYYTQDRYSTCKLWKWIYVPNLKVNPWLKLHAHPTGSNTDAVNMTVKTKINSRLTALLRFYFTFIFILLWYIFHWGYVTNKHYSKTIISERIGTQLEGRLSLPINRHLYTTTHKPTAH